MVFPIVCCGLLFCTPSWLGRAENAVCKTEQKDFSGLRELQPFFLPSPSPLPVPMVFGPGGMSGAGALVATSTGDTGPVRCIRWLPVPQRKVHRAEYDHFAWEGCSLQVSAS